jgi:dihydrofolate reductase
VRGPVSVFIACSLDGFIAGPDDDLSWLPTGDGEDYGFDAFFAGIGAMVMGRNTYRVVEGFGGDWPYGDVPVLVATTRPLEPIRPTVRAIRGTAHELLEQARSVTDRGIYVDGGDVIRQFLDAGLIDELTVTVVPAILGAGAPLFAGATHRRSLALVESKAFRTGLVQLRYQSIPA